MPAYKYQLKDGSIRWLAKFYYTANGKRKQKLKRGFKLKRDAEKYERDFLVEERDDATYIEGLEWSEFTKLYMRKIKNTISAHTFQTKRYVFKSHITPAFKGYKVKNVTTAMVQEWANSLVPDYKQSTINTIYSNMRALFNWAERVYGLNNVSSNVVRPNKRENKREMKIWTYEEFSKAIDVMTNLKGRTAVILLYWTGMRKGELFALTWADYDHKNGSIRINKSFQHLNGGRDVITPPKTSASVRTLKLPNQAIEALDEYKKHCYDVSASSLIFPYQRRLISNAIKEAVNKAGLKRIRVHDLRHSHASYLISRGANIKLVQKRLGHKDISVTLNTYAHLYPNEEDKLIDIMNAENNTPK